MKDTLDMQARLVQWADYVGRTNMRVKERQRVSESMLIDLRILLHGLKEAQVLLDEANEAIKRVAETWEQGDLAGAVGLATLVGHEIDYFFM
jgi:hypothetical protein